MSIVENIEDIEANYQEDLYLLELKQKLGFFKSERKKNEGHIGLMKNRIKLLNTNQEKFNSKISNTRATFNKKRVLLEYNESELNIKLKNKEIENRTILEKKNDILEYKKQKLSNEIQNNEKKIITIKKIIDNKKEKKNLTKNVKKDLETTKINSKKTKYNIINAQKSLINDKRLGISNDNKAKYKNNLNKMIEFESKLNSKLYRTISKMSGEESLLIEKLNTTKDILKKSKIF